MKTLKLLIKRVSLIKSMILCASILSNKSLMEEATRESKVPRGTIVGVRMHSVTEDGYYSYYYYCYYYH